MPSLTPTPPASLWHDTADPVVASVLSHYRQGVRREDLQAVRRLREVLRPATIPHYLVVVGTNGKSSTATYVARLLSAAGVRTGLYTSPHIAYWTERMLIDGLPVQDDELLGTLRGFDAVAQSQPEPLRRALRFFDVLSLVAEDVFGRHGVEVGVFEAGIGGRLDSTRALEAQVVALSSVGFDHEELLGHTLPEILLEKLGVCPPGATVVCGPLGEQLTRVARDWTSEHRVTLVETGALSPANSVALPPFQQQNLAVAVRTSVEAARRFSLPVTQGALESAATTIDPNVIGRFQRGVVAGTPFLTDTGHNVTAWRELLGTLNSRPERYVAVLALTSERAPSELAEALSATEAIESVIATTTRVRRGHTPEALAEALACSHYPVKTASPPELAFELGLQVAKQHGAHLLVTGSTYLAADFLAWQAGITADGETDARHD